ncbi:rod shape-determining protein MreD [Neobacillus thermocopriae]|uniref:Rod shape-determining protein MreD n=1 Tax=Neobacillus thermocopriae TaxID=1215031 RepID=A0A6B3TN17_9BACI|nr:rod shape-determining protein MreD [Neobacillus thermocopriae]MED3623683.1 rod shape-determining protein MreD [Neobacillus thermocopriae]MED3712902.1 rod shape-determining protein MreD [Neobacillus thermocopriae]NEX78344.1 rod shape-determining protein MreD [Neobacillus thermocopriae]
MKKFLLPLLFLLLFILESLFVQFLPSDLFGSRILVPRFLFSALLLLTIYVGKKQGIIYGAIFGLLVDVVYIEVIGIYFFLFPFVCYLISKVMQVMQSNIVVVFLATLFGIALLEVGVYEMNFLIHVTDLDFMTFINLRFYPTLILNAIFILVALYPLKRQFEKYAVALRDE